MNCPQCDADLSVDEDDGQIWGWCDVCMLDWRLDENGEVLRQRWEEPDGTTTG